MASRRAEKRQQIGKNKTANSLMVEGAKIKKKKKRQTV
jgi:hypothetical protein